MLIRLAPVAILAMFATLPTPLHADDLATLRREFVDAVEQSDTDRVTAIGTRIGELGTATAAEVLIVDGLLSDDPAVETAVHGVLELIPKGPALDWLCTRCTNHESAAVRDQLVRVLTYRTGRNVFTAILTGLLDPAEGVAVSSIRAVREKGHRAAMPHLIRALRHQEEQEKELDQVANEIRKLLIEWTGKDLFGSGEYERLWKSHKDDLLDPANRGKKDPIGEIVWEKRGTGVYARVPRFFGQEILSQHVVFVLDTSISMKAEDPPPPEEEEPGTDEEPGGRGTGVGGRGKGRGDDPKRVRGPRQRLKRVQNELVRLISDLPPDFRFTVISFDKEVEALSGRLKIATSDSKQQAIRFVRKFSADGETWTDHALEAAFQVPDARTIVLLSDGMPFRSKEPIDCFELLDQVDAWNRFEHKQVNTIGFARTAGEVGGFLQELSRRNGGSYTELP